MEEKHKYVVLTIIDSTPNIEAIADSFTEACGYATLALDSFYDGVKYETTGIQPVYPDEGDMYIAGHSCGCMEEDIRVYILVV